MSRNSSGGWGGVLRVSAVWRLEAGKACGTAVAQRGWGTKHGKGGWSLEDASHAWDHPPGLTLWTASFLYWPRLGFLEERTQRAHDEGQL